MSPASDVPRTGFAFRSVDSRPTGLSAFVPRWRAPMLLLVFTLLAVVQLEAFDIGGWSGAFPAGDYVFAPYAGEHSIAVRVYILSFFAAFALFAAGSPKARALLWLDASLRFIAVCAVLDTLNAGFLSIAGEPYPLSVVQIMAGLAGFAIFSLLLMERGVMPEGVPVKAGTHDFRRALLRLGLTTAIAAVLALLVGTSNLAVIEQLRQLTLLGGIGPGVILFLPLLFVQLYAIAVIERRIVARERFAAPLSVIVPAFNEAHVIGATIAYLDRAALDYPENVEVLVLDNGSKDDTPDVARDALAQAQALDGRVVSVPEPGKANALNRGIAEAKNEFVVRIDADTLVGPDNLRLAMQNFADAPIGVVGGVPLPPGGGLFDRARLVEVLVKHGYYSPALSAIYGLVGVPGMFVIYRAEALRQVGSFAAGMNGEDTDMSLRIGELGYHAMIDHRVRYVSEVPATFSHMREQRMRWFRSVYHVSARARDLVFSSRGSIRGKLVLPYMLLNSARRAMMVPIVLFGIGELLFANADNLLVWQAIAAVLVGAPAMVAATAALLNRKPSALLALPEYILFRLLRAYYTLESMLSIVVTPGRNTLEHRERRRMMWRLKGQA
ncbi:glycosyltransferase [Erythrobacteraceae bacterium WH01K]|nr:glycosyltransferase [Erythrobacteraceae bacterium WH01K]